MLSLRLDMLHSVGNGEPLQKTEGCYLHFEQITLLTLGRHSNK
jgi:hypothetical protein